MNFYCRSLTEVYYVLYIIYYVVFSMLQEETRNQSFVLNLGTVHAFAGTCFGLLFKYIYFKDEEMRIFQVHAVMERCYLCQASLCFKERPVFNMKFSACVFSYKLGIVLKQYQFHWLGETCVKMYLLWRCKMSNCQNSFLLKFPLVADLFLRY